MMNRLILTGRLTAEPEFKTTTSGIEVCRFCVAVDRRFKNADGKRETDFVNVVAWRQTARFVADYCHKGYMVGVDGSLQQRRWQDDDGMNRSSYEVNADSIELLGRPKGDPSPPLDDKDAPPAKGAETVPESDDGLPF